jgi:hypothetical protein
MSIDRNTESDNPLSRLQVLTCQKIRRKLTATEFLDMRTGEILDANTVQKMGARTIRPEARARREAKLNSLRKESRAFADFILKFRDSHCKFLVSLDEVVKMYSRLHGQAPEHVRRYFASLTKAGILEADQTLHEDFMIHNPAAGKTTAKGDRFRAYCVFDRMQARNLIKSGESSTY